jgi:FlaA1/EpsC-like NDP-sugar epimerase
MAEVIESKKKTLWARAASRVVQVRSDLIVVVLDMLLSYGAFTAMLVLRFDGRVPKSFWANSRLFLPMALVLILVVNTALGLYGKLWRHASVYEARRLVMAGVIVGAALFSFELIERRMPFSVVFSGTLVATFLMALVRFQSRLFSFRRTSELPGMRVVVIGAGDAGASLVASMLRSPRAGFRPVAVLDDDPARQGRSFMGINVLGGISTLPEVVAATGAHLAVMAIPNPPHATVRRAAEAAEAADVALKIVPGLTTTMTDGIPLRDVRDLRIEDLLGRQEIATDLDVVTAMLAGRCVLITGAGGSIGSEIARQVAACNPLKLVLVDHDETHLHDVAADLEGPVVQVLADIRNRRQMQMVFGLHQPSVVFHAAAHKHVPLLEAHPAEAVSTNVLGTSNVLDAALEVDVQRLVLISTDKAVYPSSVMGASKRLCEQLVIHRAPRHAAYCAVRFGNVLGSRGSVVPTFMRQIEAGGPVTVTDKRMTRYFMSIQEAVQLVLQAGALADAKTGGEVFMLDMGEPVSIYDLATRMIRLSGRKPGTDIEIRISGVRPGEKLVEELTALDESEQPTLHPSIRRVATVAIEPDVLEQGVLMLAHHATALNDARCGELLHRITKVDRAATPSSPPVA